MSDASWYHHREAQNHSPEHSRSPFLAGGMIFPPPSGMLDPCQPSSNNWKLSEISFNTRLLDFIIKKTFHFFKIFIYLSFPCWLVLISTMPETWCYEHFLCLFASSRLIALCIPQLYIALDKSICKMTKCKCKPGLDHSSIMIFK